MTSFRRTAILACALLAATGAQAQAVAMSPAFGEAMCSAWNADATLTGGLAESGWAKNDGGRGHKAMQVYRSDCPNSARIEMQIALKDNKAQCVYGGAAKSKALDKGTDYLMWAETPKWREMGSGELGPMRAMMFGSLNFEGPKMEAMGNMGPFGGFLMLVGKVPGDWSACP
ncbi:MAG: SCP2 sterol-binding domain-containing protein [Betaproteobacteria bacterium]|nr:SCP2 sterol-binding domain-containing protein [Betaproteobacteria bacterium]